MTDESDAPFSLFQQVIPSGAAAPLKGQTVCITGRLKNFRYKRLVWQKIIERGGNAYDVLDNSCNYLVVADGGSGISPKTEKALTIIRDGYPLKIIGESDLIAMLAAAPILPEAEHGKLLEKTTYQTAKKKAVKSHEFNMESLTVDCKVSEINTGEPAIWSFRYQCQYPNTTLVEEGGDYAPEDIKEFSRKAKELYEELAKHFRGKGYLDNYGSGCKISLTVRLPPEAVPQAEELFFRLLEIVPKGLPGMVTYRCWSQYDRYGREWLQKLQ